MCGIFGALGVSTKPDILEQIRHRGPDGDGFESIPVGEQEVHLGHTRLAILDLSSAGRQPMASRDGRWWITYNGEIYNHLELRKRIEGPFRGHSDTETLVEYIAQKGLSDALAQINGMFAFAALDCEEGKLYLVRDPFGIKPLYYAKNGEKFAFASEARVLRVLGFGASLDERSLRQFLTLRYVPSPDTLWDGIKRLPPGHLLWLDLTSNQTRLESYSQPTTDRFVGSFEDAVDAYQQGLREAVSRQMLSDVPVGILLSGGVDSALVAAMAKEAGTSPPCFTVGFGDDHVECEIEDARQTAEVLGLPFHAVTVNPEQLRDTLPAIANAVEEPLGTTSIMPMWRLIRRAREDVTVVLTGQGSDEPWGGYFRYQVGILGQRMPWTMPWRVASSMARLWKCRPDAIERGLRTLAETEESRRIVEACALFPSQMRCALLGDADDGGAEASIRYWLKWLDEAPSLSPAERMMRLDTRMNLADDLLLYGDKISMAASLEARVPMLDIELVRLIESFPLEYRIRWQRGKVAHKAMAERFLPSEIVHRPKKGFQVPFGIWSRSIWRDWVEAELMTGLDGLLDLNAVRNIWREHADCRPDRSRQIFALLMLALWNKTNGLGEEVH